MIFLKKPKKFHKFWRLRRQNLGFFQFFRQKIGIFSKKSAHLVEAFRRGSEMFEKFSYLTNTHPLLPAIRYNQTTVHRRFKVILPIRTN